MSPAPLLPLAALACLLPLSGLCNSTPPAGRSISPRRHAGPIEPLWPILEGPRFRISTAPVTLPGPTPFAGVVDGSSAWLALNLGSPSCSGVRSSHLVYLPISDLLNSQLCIPAPSVTPGKSSRCTWEAKQNKTKTPMRLSISFLPPDGLTCKKQWLPFRTQSSHLFSADVSGSLPYNHLPEYIINNPEGGKSFLRRFQRSVTLSFIMARRDTVYFRYL